jgi:hypothetical protein
MYGNLKRTFEARGSEPHSSSLVRLTTVEYNALTAFKLLRPIKTSRKEGSGEASGD